MATLATATRYVRPRAESLAVMYLTRRSDLAVSPHPADDDAVNLFVSIRKAGRKTGRMFGVQVDGAVSRSGADRNGGLRGRQLAGRLAPWVKSIPFPVCLFYFTM